jgi:CheY-like chemotaxis protein/HPt (histidine-containing phosphotransfer) domain-containing protein
MLGQIGVISKAGSGSSFWIELPFKAVAKTLSAYYEATPVVDQEILFRGRVLLVDDNDINLMLGTMLLEDLGVSVATANSGEQAVELAVGEDFDLVLMDISMPGIDGFEATRRICADEGGQDIPVVALSAYASSVEQEKSRACGMRGYLTKPIEREKLLSTLETWLLRKGKDEQLFADEQAVIQEPVRLDREVLGNLLKQIGRERLSSIILKFCDEADRRWRTLQLASNNNDVVREAHTLASTCRSFGLPEVADALNVIEAQANTPVGSSSDFVAETGQKLNRGMLALKAELSNF